MKLLAPKFGEVDGVRPSYKNNESKGDMKLALALIGAFAAKF
jgi:hypothetical protein